MSPPADESTRTAPATSESPGQPHNPNKPGDSNNPGQPDEADRAQQTQAIADLFAVVLAHSGATVSEPSGAPTREMAAQLNRARELARAIERGESIDQEQWLQSVPQLDPKQRARVTRIGRQIAPEIGHDAAAQLQTLQTVLQLVSRWLEGDAAAAAELDDWASRLDAAAPQLDANQEDSAARAQRLRSVARASIQGHLAARLGPSTDSTDV